MADLLSGGNKNIMILIGGVHRLKVVFTRFFELTGEGDLMYIVALVTRAWDN